MTSKAGMKYRQYTSKRPHRRRACLLQSRWAALEKLFGSEQEVGEKMEQAARFDGHGEAFPDRREQVSRVFRTASRSRKNAVKVKAELNTEMETRLREANENLVVASVNAQVMTEAIEKILVHLSHMAEHDLLTGLPNRALLTDRLVQSISLAKRNGNKLALMFLDVDHFKDINDSMGHAIGDQLLQSVAKRLQASVRNSDTVSRHGGDEFVVLLPEVGEMQSVVHSAEKLIQSVGEPHLISGQELHVTLSIGISMYPADGVDADVLMRNADMAMYQAKKAGRNSYKIFTPSMNTRLITRTPSWR
jgi:diguanylate cyclase (GGDEF)-like protein